MPTASSLSASPAKIPTTAIPNQSTAVAPAAAGLRCSHRASASIATHHAVTAAITAAKAHPRNVKPTWRKRAAVSRRSSASGASPPPRRVASTAANTAMRTGVSKMAIDTRVPRSRSIASQTTARMPKPASATRRGPRSPMPWNDVIALRARNSIPLAMTMPAAPMTVARANRRGAG